MSRSIRAEIDFSYRLSKNDIYRIAVNGKRRWLTKTDEAKARQHELAFLLKNACQLNEVTFVQGKVWLNIMVWLPDHTGDAINVLDIVSDAVQDAIDVDDRWYCVRSLSWAIDKDEPRILVEVTQYMDEPHASCSTCGEIKPHTEFHRDRSQKSGHDSRCKECKNAAARIAG